MVTEFERDRHCNYFKQCLTILPHHYESNDCMRMTLAYFILIAIDILDIKEMTLKPQEKQSYIEWIYAQQLHDISKIKGTSGFRGSPFISIPTQQTQNHSSISIAFHESYNLPHVTMTYNALCMLLILEDDLSRVDRTAIITSLKSLQRPDGSVAPFLNSYESDVRFIYCAAAICYILNDWNGLDKDKAVEYIRQSHAYDGGIGQSPWLESHGGLTYCAIAALALMERLEDGLVNREKTLKWLVDRQLSGFQGRINKPTDTCYSFWIGAAISILSPKNLIDNETPLSAMIDSELNRMFLLSTQSDPIGGFSKFSGHYPDVLHSCFGLTGLSLMQKKDMTNENEIILPVDPLLVISQRASYRIKEIHRKDSK